jgi:chromosome segregation ATPase
MPEAQLEKTKEEAKSLNEALEKTKTEIDEINNLFDNYDNAKKALEECTKGTKAWYEALENVNDSVLSLLEKYPELYDSNKYPGAIDTTGDYTVIDPEAIEQII